ncbi:MAG: DUF3341 domain-containing protein [Phycisphaeraceae bacterium]
MSESSPKPHAAPRGELYGLLGEFEEVTAVVAAAKVFRDEGFTEWDVHSPFPIHGIDKAMGAKPTILPWLVLIGGVLGLIAGIVLSWWTNAVNYPYLISGKPQWSFAANVPVIFETTVLFAAFTAGLGMLVLNKLPLLYHPLFKSRRFRRVTSDRFFIVIEAHDPKFDLARVKDLLKASGAKGIEEIFEDL